MTKRQPTKLGKEPLVEAVCQIQVSGKVALNTFFPGLLFAKHEDHVSELQQLPAAMLPEQLRATQPAMAFVPLIRLKFKDVSVLIGERAVTVSNVAPYLGWAKFRPLIVEVLNALLESKLVSSVDRYSLKYTNVLKDGDVPDSLRGLDWQLKIGQLDVNLKTTTLRAEVLTDDLATIITLSGGVTVQAEGQVPAQGSLIDIDTICQTPQDAASFVASMPNALDRVRCVNKEVFFECLTDEAINALDPSYE